jgi:citronellol/citronellal dehydrogenase
MAVSSAKVAIITGASRGIGRALALGLAREGWSVVIAAKSTESTERLPGSIHSVAQEVEALGGQALPVQVDVRDEAQIEAMVAQTIDRFGRIDLLINNAGALHWQNLLETPASHRALPTRARPDGGHPDLEGTSGRPAAVRRAGRDAG